MKAFNTENIRNLAVIGHGDAGKTQLVSSLLYVAGATPRWGKVDEGTTVTDHDADSIERKVSLNNNFAHLEYKDTKINLIDTPGYAAFVSHARPALRVADCALVVVDAVHGIEVQTEKTWQYANEFLLPRFMVINKMDKEHADFGHALETATSSFARSIVPFSLPIGTEANFKGVVDVVHQKAYSFDENGKAKEIPIPEEGRDIFERTRERLIEIVAESDDALMEKYFADGTLPEEDIYPNLAKAIASSKLCPVYAVSSSNLVGLQLLLDHIVEFAPNPATHEAEYGFANSDMTGDRISRKYSNDEPFSAYVFRTIADPFAGRINVMKIVSGKVVSDATVQNTSRDSAERLGALHLISGKTLEKVDSAQTGDIIAVVKLKDTQTGDTLSDKAKPIVYPKVEYPEAAIAFAIEPKSRADEEKISVALHKVLEEDPSLTFERDPQTKEFILSGSGQLHIETVVDKLNNRFHVEVTLHPPKVPYKETITASCEVQGRHKKQSGGRGQFGDCKVIFEPLERGGGFEWVDKIFGGAVPQNFRPAIEKGILEAAAGGAVAGYPLVDFKVTLIDGSYHTVDSDEHSFKAAGRKAFRAAMERAKPTLLEPIMDVEVFTPQEASGDIMGDLNSRRGRVGGMEMRGKQQVIKAKVPLSEMLDYQSKLNSVTQARGSYHMQFSHYDPLPHNLAQKVIDEAVAAGRVRAQDDDE
ncbi:MAG: elongation factor G [Acidobacteria bacterium ACB1]|nr:Elongation factor G [Pyrinomonadaceae bacterium]MCE7963190.1 elongation factor G [Acidobacteria bacterium ACB1]RIJ91802.1 MAG: elongation factor G [Acidobacteriota bacterium]